MVLDGVSFFLCDRAKTDFLFSFMLNCFFYDSLLFLLIIELSHLINGNYLKRASPKAANIHNRW